jgi:predicted nucleic acid-binding Zn ribbon protein
MAKSYFIYEYRCLDCRDDIECPVCQSKNIQRVYSTPNIIFRGKGFFKTDNQKIS